jgi:hypothetical protein
VVPLCFLLRVKHAKLLQLPLGQRLRLEKRRAFDVAIRLAQRLPGRNTVVGCISEPFCERQRLHYGVGLRVLVGIRYTFAVP